MPSTTAYGYRIPDTNDLSKGASGWMTSLAFNWARVSAHTHNGTDSPLLTINAFSPYTVEALSGDWAANPGGSGIPAGAYRQLVTAPAGITEVNDYLVKFIISTVGATRYQQVYLDWQRQSGTTFYLYCNDNTIDILCVFR